MNYFLARYTFDCYILFMQHNESMTIISTCNETFGAVSAFSGDTEADYDVSDLKRDRDYTVQDYAMQDDDDVQDPHEALCDDRP